MNSNKTLTEVFVRRCSPVYWLITAEELQESCSHLAKCLDSKSQLILTGYHEPIKSNEFISKNLFSKGFFLLAGFAIENLLKGILISKNARLINKGKLDNSIKNHNLKSLLTKIDNAKFDEEIIDFIDLLSQAILYWGRYPAPLIAEKLNIEKGLDEDYLKLFNTTYKSLHFMLVKSLKNGWKSGLDNGVGDINNLKWNTFDL